MNKLENVAHEISVTKEILNMWIEIGEATEIRFYKKLLQRHKRHYNCLKQGIPFILKEGDTKYSMLERG